MKVGSRYRSSLRKPELFGRPSRESDDLIVVVDGNDTETSDRDRGLQALVTLAGRHLGEAPPSDILVDSLDADQRPRGIPSGTCLAVNP